MIKELYEQWKWLNAENKRTHLKIKKEDPSTDEYRQTVIDRKNVLDEIDNIERKMNDILGNKAYVIDDVVIVVDSELDCILIKERYYE